MIFRKINLLLQMIWAVPIVLLFRLIRPLFLIRFVCLPARMGHLAGDIELYLCEKDLGINVPSQLYLDLFYKETDEIANIYLLRKWEQILSIFPHRPIFYLDYANSLIPGGEVHKIVVSYFGSRKLLSNSNIHIKFTPSDEEFGDIEMRKFGIPMGAKIVCLNVRDSAYLNSFIDSDWSYHAYRDSDVDNYLLAVNELTRLGYYVVRMGKKVKKPLKIEHPLVIDYACSELRSDMMDIYLGSKCEFCITTVTGWDVVPTYLFRKPVVYTNFAPICDVEVFPAGSVFTPKKCLDLKAGRELSLREICARGLASAYRSSDYELEGVRLLENTPREILNVTVEMVKRLTGSWKSHEHDDSLQDRFWKICEENALRLSSESRPFFCADYLRNNQGWLE